jgi:Lon protease-like protein
VLSYYSAFGLLVNPALLSYNTFNDEKGMEMINYDKLPLFPLRTVLFPGQALPLHIFEPRYRQMIADCLEGDGTFGVLLIRAGEEVGQPAVPYEVGTTAVIEDVEKLSDGRMNIITLGQERFQLHGYESVSKPYLVGRVSPWPWDEPAPSVVRTKRTVRHLVSRYVDLLAQASETEINLDPIPQDPLDLATLAAVVLQITPEQKQALLEIPSIDELLGQLDHLLRQENRMLRILLAATPSQSKMDGMFSHN